MNLKNNKGITLITLGIAVVIIMTITVALVYNTSNQISVLKINHLYNDIDIIKQKVDSYFLKYGELPILCDYITQASGGKTKFVELLDNNALAKKAALSYEIKVNPNDGEDYYVIDLERLENITVNYGYDDEYQTLKENKQINASNVEDKIYVINGLTHEVYYPHGIFDDGIMYYAYKLDTNKLNLGLNTINLGDYVDYTYDDAANYDLPTIYSGYTEDQSIAQTKNLKWQVFKIYDDGSIDILADTNSTSTQTVSLRDAVGYNNAVFLINDICKKHYSNTALGIEARSIKIEDIEEHFTETGWARARANQYKGYVIGDTITVENRRYPAIYEREIGAGVDRDEPLTAGIERSDSVYTSPTTEGSKIASTKLVTTHTGYYGFGPKEEDMDNSAIRKMLFNNEKIYFLASREVHLLDVSAAADFGISRVNTAGITLKFVYNTGNNVDTNASTLRPIVHIDSSSIAINVREGTQENPHKILKK